MSHDFVLVIIVSTILFMMLVILVVIFVLYHKKKLLRQKLAVQAMSHRHSLDLMQATIETQEREQMRLGKDLHDDIGALLTATKLQLQQAQRYLGEDGEATPFLSRTEEMLTESIKHVRTVAHNLVPPTLEHFGLLDAVQTFVQRFSNSGDLNIKVLPLTTLQRCEQQTEISLFRITQELLTNTVKHARATQVSISLAMRDGQIELTYRDDGRGFDPAKIGHGIGLKNLESRAAMLAGSFKFTSAPESGFEAIIKVPLHHPKNLSSS